jgi:poly(3-hydroxybutyrate) depolymerase
VLFGLVKSAKTEPTYATARYFAHLAGIASPPVATHAISTDGFGIGRSLWSGGSTTEIELIAIEGAGHVFPQPFYRARRLLGPSPKDPNAAEVIWTFLERQRPR